jgi:hypothetical protein
MLALLDFNNWDELEFIPNETGAVMGDWVTPAVKQHPPVHHQGWMICDQETDICWVPVP